MTRRRAKWLFGIASVALLAALVAIDFRMQDAGGQGIIDFELAGTKLRAGQILDAWGSDGRRAARLSLLLDYPFIVSYGAFWALACLGVAQHARTRGWRLIAGAGRAFAAFAVAAAAFDAIEDVGLLLALGRHGGAVAPRLAAVCATVKFALIYAVLLYVGVALVRRLAARSAASRWAAIAVAALVVAGLVANAAVTSRETDAAHARGGRIVHLPQADLNVSDMGPRTDSALVLLHGWASSMRWWEPAARILSRERRVIRIDLLGHGGSEKPRRGYAIANQARLMLEVVRRLGVRRALVAGHSLGGIVAVSMAEQDRRLVRGVAVLDSPPARRFILGSSLGRLAFIPVLGEAYFRAAPRSAIRRGLEVGLARHVHVPERFVDDVEATTYTSFTHSALAADDYLRAQSLDRRMTATGVPLLVLFGREDRIVDPHAASAWQRVPGARVVGLAGVGHSPEYERPGETSRLLLGFAGSVLQRR